MNWHKWLIRGLVLTLLGVLAAAATLYALWTNPQAIRQLVQEKLGVRFLDVGVQVGSARLRLLGGILVRELRLARSNALDREDFLFVPSAVIYHDKEQILDGKVAIRRVELDRPQLRLIRERDGRFNLTGILGPVDLSERMPTVVLRQGSLVFEDRSWPGSPLLEIRNLQLTMINDPLPTLQFEGTGTVDVLGPVRFRASVPRATLAAAVELELPSIPVSADLMRRVAALCADAGTQLARLTGLADLRVKLQLPDRPGNPVAYDATLHLTQGKYEHDLLPRPLERLSLTARLLNGVIPEAKLTASSGPTNIEARVADFRLPEHKPDLDALERLAGELDLSVRHLRVDDAVLSRLPPELRFLKEEYAPAGPISLHYRYRRAGASPLAKEWTFAPEGMTCCFDGFPYPVNNVGGSIWLDNSRSPVRELRLDLTGLGGGRPVALRGTIQGAKKTSAVAIDITGSEITLDDRVFNALSPRVQAVARQFLPALSRKHGLAAFPMGRADVQTTLRRERGQRKLEKRFTIAFKNSSVLYDQFPYPLQDVSGVLVIHPDHWEAKGFHGVHRGGELFVDGRSHALPGRAVLPAGEGGQPAAPERIQVRIRGVEIPLDQEFETALVPASGKERLELQAAWKRLRLAGRLSFAAEVIDHAGQPQDIDVSVDVHGCAMRPAFFDYALEGLSGSVRYARGWLYLRDMKARHGSGQLSLSRGLIEVAPEGGFRAWLQGMSGRDVAADADLLQALPEPLRRVLEPLRLKVPMDFATKLTLVSPGAAKPLKVWWESLVGLRQAAFRTGIDVTDATGQCFVEGHHDGQRLQYVSGKVSLERASVLGQPLSNFRARLEIDPAAPEALCVRDVRADLFGGTVGGQARVVLSPALKYDLLLEALGVKLEQLGQHNLGDKAREVQLQGPAHAALHLVGEGSDLLSLKGNGQIEVAQGKMGQLPLLLGLVKALNLREPDRTMFEQAQMRFAIEGPRVQVQQLDLFGNAISLRGEGTVDLDGSNVSLDFSATPGRVTQMLPAGLDQIPQAISGQLLKIKMRGKLGKGGQIKFDKELIPGVFEPLRRVVGGS
jgi:hypothetical protein